MDSAPKYACFAGYSSRKYPYSPPQKGLEIPGGWWVLKGPNI